MERESVEVGKDGGSSDAAEVSVLRLSRWKELFKRVAAERAELTPASPCADASIP